MVRRDGGECLDELSEKEQNYLQTIRRFHWNWLRNEGRRTS